MCADSYCMSHDSSIKWDTVENGVDLLKHLGDLAMQAEANLWTSSALFGASQGVLLLAFFSLAALAVSNANPLFVSWWTGAVRTVGVALSIGWAGALYALWNRLRVWVARSSNLASQIRILDDLFWSS